MASHPDTQTPAAGGSAGLKRLGIGPKTLAVLVFAVVVYTALLFFGETDSLLASLSSVDPWVVLAALFLSTGNFVVRWFRWQYYLTRLEMRVPVADSVLVFLSGFSMALTPMKTGEVLKSLMLKQTHDLPIAKTAPILVAERVTDLGGLVLLSALGCLAFEHGVVIAATGAVAVALLMAVCSWRPLGELLLSLVARMWVIGALAPRIRAAYGTLWDLTGPAPFFIGLAAATAAWGLQCASLYVVTTGFAGVTLTLEASLFAYAAPLLAGTLAMLPGGLGLTEASMTALILKLGGADVSRAIAVSLTLIVRFCALWWGVAVGFVALAAWRARSTSRRAVPQD